MKIILISIFSAIGLLAIVILSNLYYYSKGIKRVDFQTFLAGYVSGKIDSGTDKIRQSDIDNAYDVYTSYCKDGNTMVYYQKGGSENDRT